MGYIGVFIYISVSAWMATSDVCDDIATNGPASVSAARGIIQIEPNTRNLTRNVNCDN